MKVCVSRREQLLNKYNASPQHATESFKIISIDFTSKLKMFVHDKLFLVGCPGQRKYFDADGFIHRKICKRSLPSTSWEEQSQTLHYHLHRCILLAIWLFHQHTLVFGTAIPRCCQRLRMYRNLELRNLEIKFFVFSFIIGLHCTLYCCNGLPFRPKGKININFSQFSSSQRGNATTLTTLEPIQ